MKHSTLFSWGNEVCSRIASATFSGTVKAFALMVFLFLWGIDIVSAQSPAPSNDLCSGAININCGQAINGSTEFATADDVYLCSNSFAAGEPGVWFTHVGTGANVRLRLNERENPGAWDTFLAVYTGSCDDLTCVTYDDDSGPALNAFAQFFAEEGVTYYIYATGYDTDGNADGDSGPFRFRLRCLPACEPSLELACVNDVMVECGQENNLEITGSPEVDLNTCNDDEVATLTAFNSEVIINNCTRVITRTWVATYGDLVATCIQTITVVDTTAPVISGVEPVITVECLESVPVPAEASALDACSGVVDITSFQSNSGELISSCDLSTAFGPGADWAIWLPTLYELGYAASTQFNFVGDGSFDQFVDGTAHLYGTIANNVNPNQQFVVDFWFENKSNWEEWSALGRSYKDDLNCVTSGQNEDWTYYEMVNNFSSMTGAGDYAGDVLYFQHMPINYYFGLQIGQGANNKNCNFGLSTWFYFNGFMDGNAINGLGDVNADASCEPNLEQDCVHNTSFTYLYRAQDNCGRASIVSQQIIVDDNVAPSFVDCPASDTIECGTELPAVAELSAIDNCSGDVVVLYVGAEENVISSCLTEITRTWSATDVCGNRSFCTQVISIEDTTAPAFENLPAAEVTYECSAVVEAPELVATDICNEFEITFNEDTIAGNCPGYYTLVRTWTATDVCENTSSFQQTVNVVDTTAPQFDEYEFYTSVNCEDLPAILTASDNCGEATVVVSFEQLNSGGCLGVLYRIYTATDECGNTATTEQYITIVDVTAPVINGVGEETSIECSEVEPGEDSIFGAGDVFGTDNCEGEVTIEYSEQIVMTDDNCPQSYDVIRTWVATDYCENVSTASQLVHIIDTTAPTFSDYEESVTISCDQELPAAIVGVSDNCGEATYTHNDVRVDGNCVNNYVIERTFTAVDECGNTSSLTVFINVQDTTAPVVEGQTEIIVECGDDVPVIDPTATDNCEGEITMSYVDYSTISPWFEIRNGGNGVVDLSGLPSNISVIGSNGGQLTNVYTAAAVVAKQVNISFNWSYQSSDVDGPFYDPFGYWINGEFTQLTGNANGNNQTGSASILVPAGSIFAVGINAVDNIFGAGSVALSNVAVEAVAVECPITDCVLRQYTVADACGNETIFNQFIVTRDITAPAFDEYAYEIERPCDDFEGTYVTATDACSEVTITFEDEMVSGACAGRVIRTYTATDACDNSSTTVQVITLIDNVDPIATFTPESFEVECGQPYEMSEATFSDNCDMELEVSEDINTSFNGCETIITYTWTAVDHCFNETSVSATITIVDTTNPFWTSFPDNETIECDQEVPAIVMPTAGDLCDDNVDVEYTTDTIAGECANTYTIARHFRGFDNCGNGVLGTQLIIVQDTQAPSVEGQTEVVVECGDAIPVIDPTATDNCEGEITMSFVDYNTISPWFEINNGGNGSVDLSGLPSNINVIGSNSLVVSNIFTAAAVIAKQVEISFAWDYQASDSGDGSEEPSFYDQFGYWINGVFTPINVVNGPSAQEGNFSVIVPAGSVFALGINSIDNIEGEGSVSISNITVEEAELECPITDCILRQYTVADACGNETIFNQFIVTQDTTSPVFDEYVIEIERPCDNYEGIFVTASDVCSEVTITPSDDFVSGTCQGRIIRTYTATDACGNTATAQQIITLVDEVAPMVVAEPVDFEVECGDDSWEVAVVTFTDNCANVEEISVEFTQEFVAQGCTGYYVAQWVAEDNCGNITTIDQIITVVDTQDPYFSFVPGNYAAECDQELVYENPIAGDLCSIPAVTIAVDTVFGDCPNTYVITRTFTATDNCGNTAVETQEISVEDNTAPEFDLENAVYQLSFECGDAVEGIEPVATDNCNLIEIAVAETLFVDNSCYSSGAFIYTATDACGNVSEPFYQFFTIEDTTAPEVTGSLQIERPCDNYQGIFIEATDVCNNISFDYDDVIVSGGCQGRVIRTYTVSDDCGNETEFVQNIILTDVTLPEIAVEPMDLTIECGQDVPGFIPVFSDNCDEMLTVVPSSSISMDGCVEVITRTWTATDNCGNALTVDQVIRIEDNTDPFFTNAPESFEAQCGSMIALEEATASDICAGEITPSYNEETIDGDCEGTYTLVRTWVATDDCGNQATHIQTITVVDEVAPEFTSVPSNFSVYCGDYNGFEMAMATDLCSTPVVTFEDVTSENAYNEELELCGYTVTRTWTAVDDCGNESMVSRTAFVYDNVAPFFNDSVENVIVACASEIPALVELTAGDECGDASVERTSTVQSSDDCGNQVILVSYIAEDECGNIATTSYTITVADGEAPVLSIEPADLVLACEDAIPAAPSVEATDNCTENIEVIYTQTYVGDMPAEGSIADCNLLTPALPAGNPCNYPTAWAMALFNMPSAHRYYVVQSGDFVEYPNGTVVVTAVLENAFNENAGFNVNVTFSGKKDWAEWSSQSFPTSFKADCGASDENYQEWFYFLLQNGEGAELVGWGDYAGSALNLTHAPSNNYFGFQLGDGANNYNNADNAFGGWFTYSGTFVLPNQTSISTVSGAGDFAFELDCCPDYSVVRCWTAFDCSGNEVSHCQTITFAGSTNNDDEVAPVTPSEEVAALEVAPAVVVFPNPATDMTNFVFTASENGKATIEIFDLAGARVGMIYASEVVEGTEYKTSYETSNMATGVYMYRLTNGGKVEMGRLIINK
ncbi:MAG: T9SS type A sorting domain-containing protein [Flavobacteriales bacterium]